MEKYGWAKLLVGMIVVAIVYWLASMLCDDTTAEAYYIGVMASVLCAGWVMREGW